MDEKYVKTPRYLVRLRDERDDEIESLKATIAARDRKIAELRDEGPGTPIGILNALSEFARRECGHNPASSQSAIVTLMEYVGKLKARIEQFEEAADAQ